MGFKPAYICCFEPTKEMGDELPYYKRRVRSRSRGVKRSFDPTGHKPDLMGVINESQVFS